MAAGRESGNLVPITTNNPNISIETMQSVINDFVPLQHLVRNITCPPAGDISATNHFRLNSITIQNVDEVKGKILFAKIEANVLDTHTKKNVPGIAFLRGGSVAILVVLIDKESKEKYLNLLHLLLCFILSKQIYTILTVQPRVPIGSYAFAEIPAGMLDGEDNFVGVAAKELREETGIELKVGTNLVCLSDVFFPAFPGLYPSPGGCDEFIKLYVYENTVTMHYISILQGKFTGNYEENENITLKVIKLADLHHIPDAKALACLFLYHKLQVVTERENENINV